MTPCVVIPTFDNPRTVAAVAEGALARCPDVIVVDDGSHEATERALLAVRGITLLRHDRNRGKGAALHTGLAEAERRGFSHAITLDADGQHVTEDVAHFVAAARENPGALILGHRDLAAAGAGVGSRIGRKNSNFWTWVTTGLRLPDTQSGFRCYPVAAIQALELGTTGYDFEIEVLVKAAWTGVPVISIPIQVRYFRGAERVSHLRPFWDFVRIGRLNARLVTQRICLPAPFLAMRSRRAFHRQPWRARWRDNCHELFVREPGSRQRMALSVWLGLFIGLSPLWGFQTALTLIAAHALNLSKPIAVVASNISFPLMIPAILYASLVLGRLVVGECAGSSALASLELVPRDAPAWLIGSCLLALIVSSIGAVLTYLALTVLRKPESSK